MKRSDELRELLFDKQKEVAKLNDLAAEEKRMMTAKELDQFEELRSEINSIKKNIAAAEYDEENQRSKASNKPGFTSEKTHSKIDAALRRAHSTKADQAVKTNFFGKSEQRLLSPADNGGANLIAQPIARSLYEEQTAQSFLPLLSTVEADQNQTFPILARDGRTTPSGKAYDAAATESNITVTPAQVDLKNYMTYLKTHNNMFRDSSIDLGSRFWPVIQTDITLQVGTDVLSGSGSSNNIKGLDSITGVQTFDQGGAITDFTPFTQAVRMLGTVNANLSNLTMIAHPLVWEALANLTDSTGQPLMMPKQLENIRTFSFAPIATDQGAGSDTTIYIGDLSRFQLAYRDEVYLSTNTGPSMAKDQTDILGLMRFDLLPMEPDHLVRITGVTVS